MNNKKEMTAPITSVGADAGQSLTKSNISIATVRPDCNSILQRRRATWQR